MESPIVLWVAIIVVVGGFLLGFFEKSSGTIGRTFAAWTDARRRAAGSQHEYDVNQIRDLNRQIEQLRDWQSRHDEALADHRRWDIRVVEALGKSGIVIEPPPPLYPTDKSTT